MALAANTSHKGIIQSPTGSMKTLVQAEIVAQRIETGKFSVTLVKSPRIGLSNQLAKTYSEYWSKGRLTNSQGYITFLAHSGDSADFDIDENLTDEEKLEVISNLPEMIDSLSSVEEISKRAKRALELKRPLVVFTTYHSNLKVVKALEDLGLTIDLDINDESHYLVREDFSKILDEYDPSCQYHFTATPVFTSSKIGKGMNNESRFGKFLYQMSIKACIDLGIILPLQVRTVKSGLSAVDQKTLDQEVGEIIFEAFAELEATFPSIGAKLLVAAKGAKQIENFIKKSEEYRLLIDQGVNILTVHSNSKLITHNGVQVTRNQFDTLKDKLGKEKNTKLIIVHFDILSEGIDIQGLLGCLILRKMTLSKFLQTVGRIVRVLRDSEGNKCDLKNFGLLMFPAITDMDMVAEFTKMIGKIAEEGYMPVQLLSEDNAKGKDGDDDDQFNGLDDTSANPLQENIDLMLYIDPFQQEIEEKDPFDLFGEYI